MKDENAPATAGAIEPTFFRKPSSRQEGKKLHLEAEIEALPRPEITWRLGDEIIQVGFPLMHSKTKLKICFADNIISIIVQETNIPPK